ncbi:DUF3426 domain-containing protein [Stutzerimonas zhaodongensis]|uniref:DUF3426 domain-containing protein n=1 Tax=Stutzerimonas TaxID=2901164 RepID=UPI00388EC9DB
MTSFVTQCPHCQTSFRVNRTQLAAAQGVVRCGACMELFNAARYLQQADITGSTPESPDASNPAAFNETLPNIRLRAEHPEKKDDTLWIHDDLDLDSLDLDEELAKLERQELELSRELLQLAPKARDQQQVHPAAKEDDEAWAEQLLKAESVPHIGVEPLQEDLADGTEPTIDTPAFRFAPVTADHPAPPSPLAPSNDHVVAQLKSPGRAEPVFEGLADPDDGLPHPTPASRSGGDDEDASSLSARDRPSDRLFDLEDEPLQLDWEARRRPWGRWLGWGFLNLIALLALAGQYVTYNFDELARQDEYRPWLERICPALGCELPPRVDISQIKSSNLVVRSHPEFAGALVVDAIIYNRAPFPQPFPLLEVRFADIQGKTLAQRVFKPGEYLSGELAGQLQMPSQIPIHIALDILDPGISAVNYSLAFRSPD